MNFEEFRQREFPGPDAGSGLEQTRSEGVFLPGHWQEKISGVQRRLGEQAPPSALSWAEEHHPTLHWEARKSFQVVELTFAAQNAGHMEKALADYERIHLELFEACRKSRSEPEGILPEVVCGSCANFSPDGINPDEGMGACSLAGYPRASQASPWPMARRRCPAWDNGGER